MAWLAYNGVKDVRWALARAEALVERDRTVAAVELLQEVLQELDRRPFVAGLQARQFEAHAALHELGAGRVSDPLFEVTIGPGAPLPIEASRSCSGVFAAALDHLGLRLHGTIESDEAFAGSRAIEITLDERPIRRLTLPAKRGPARFDALVRRPALAGFPRHGRLGVRTVESRTGTGRWLRVGRSDHVVCSVPHGDATLPKRAAAGPPIDKKGRLRPDPQELRVLQEAYLELYTQVSATFEALADRPLFLLYGTLLGLYRDGDFIPGDDDFDVGYVSNEQRPEAVKAEAIELMRGLVAAGFDVSVNRRGKPFRVRAPHSPPGSYLDARPVWARNGRVWAHKQACLALPLTDFAEVWRVPFRGVEVAIPRGTESFLSAYYGTAWRVPDPAFSNATTQVPTVVQRTLARACLTPDEVARLERESAADDGPGSFCSIATHALYPLEVFERRVGW